MAGCSSTTHPLPSARPHSVLPSSTPLMRLRHLRARTRARPLLCSLALDSVAFASPLCGHCQVNVPPPPLPPSLSAYPCMVFTMYDERQLEYAARYAFTGIQRHPPTVRAPPFGFSSFPSHHLMVGVVCCLFSFFSFHAPFFVHRFHTYGRPSPPASHDHFGREGWFDSLSLHPDRSALHCVCGALLRRAELAIESSERHSAPTEALQWTNQTALRVGDANEG